VRVGPSRASGSNTGGAIVTRERSSGRSAQPRTGAQSRHPRPGTGTGYGGRSRFSRGPAYGVHGGYYRSPYYGYRYPSYGYPYYGSRPYWGSGFYVGFGWPWLSFNYSYGYPYNYPYNYPYAYGGTVTHRVEHVQFEPTGAIRLQVGPNKALVYVDGDYVGIVDDFDGMFQKLVLPTGRHEISIEIDGYRTHQIAVYIGEGQTLKYRADLERGEGPPTYDDLTGGEAYAGPVQTSQQRAEAPPRQGFEYPRAESDATEAARVPADAGRMRIDVRPEDATVYVDGHFVGTSQILRREPLPVPPGPHLIEVVRPGYKTYQATVEIKSGETSEIAIDLRPN